MYTSQVAANISSLAKITDDKTFDIILHASNRPLLQLNLPVEFLKPTKDKPLKTSEERRMTKLQKLFLPWHDAAILSREPKHNPTRQLTAAEVALPFLQ